MIAQQLISTGHTLENAVYLHLRQSTKEIYYFQQEEECDFVTIQHGKAKQLIQVCYELNEMNLHRETKGLFGAMRFFNQKEGIIVTQNQRDCFTEGEMTIKVVPAFEFMGGS